MHPSASRATSDVTLFHHQIGAFRDAPREVDRSVVLLAEDDHAMRSFLAQALRELGYEVIEAIDGRDALERMNFRAVDGRWLAHVDVVIADVRMPGATGLELLEDLRRVEWATSVVLISAFADDEVRREAERLGAAAVLSKPFKLSELLRTVQDLVPPH